MENDRVVTVSPKSRGLNTSTLVLMASGVSGAVTMSIVLAIVYTVSSSTNSSTINPNPNLSTPSMTSSQEITTSTLINVTTATTTTSAATTTTSAATTTTSAATTTTSAATTTTSAATTTTSAATTTTSASTTTTTFPASTSTTVTTALATTESACVPRNTTDQYVGLCENCRDPPEYEDLEMKYLTFPDKHAVYTFSNRNNTTARLVNFYMAIEALSLGIHVGFPSGNMTYEKNFDKPLHNDKDVIDIYVSNGTYSFSLIRLDLLGPSKPFYSGATIAFVTIETC